MLFKEQTFNALDRLYLSQNKADFAKAAIEVIEGCLPSVVIAFHEVTFMRTSDQVHECRDARATDEVRLAWDRQSMNSPVVQYYRAGGTEPVISTQELISDVKLRNSELYAECWKPFGATHQTGIRIWDGASVTGVSIKRDGRFFECENALLKTLYPHFSRAYRNLESEIYSLRALGFTPRECEVYHWMSEGKRDGEIAAILGCATKTVGKHIEAIFAKLSVETRMAAVRAVQRWRRRLNPSTPAGHAEGNGIGAALSAGARRRDSAP